MTSFIVCAGAERKVLEGTKKLIEVARQLRSKGCLVAWVAPGFVGKSYALQAERLHRQQVSLWREVAPEAGVIVVDQWPLTAPLFYEQSRDAVHYHTIIGGVSCDRAIDGSEQYNDALLACYNGPVPIYTLKLLVNGLLNVRSHQTSGAAMVS